MCVWQMSGTGPLFELAAVDEEEQPDEAGLRPRAVVETETVTNFNSKDDRVGECVASGVSGCHFFVLLLQRERTATDPSSCFMCLDLVMF